MPGKARTLITIFGESKTLAEWARDSRCAVGYEALRNRILDGMDPATALTSENRQGYRAKAGITSFAKVKHCAFGKELTVVQWAKEPECQVSRATLARRLDQGTPIEQALCDQPMPRDLRGKVALPEIQGFGEMKSLADWARDPRAEVTSTIIARRLNQGWTLEDAIRRVARWRGRQISAFGETKSQKEWLHDPRCRVCEKTLRERLAAGIDLEEALTKSATYRKPPAQFEAFGQVKTLEEWVSDESCKVKARTLAARLRQGWNLEDALTTGKQTKQRVPKQYEAFGERKTLHEWARDPRCQVGYAIIRIRHKKGMPLEEAMSFKRNLPPDPRTKLITAFGETKGVREWSRDPRCLCAYSTLVRRLSLGQDLEDSLRVADNQVLRPIWNERKYKVDALVTITDAKGKLLPPQPTVAYPTFNEETRTEVAADEQVFRRSFTESDQYGQKEVERDGPTTDVPRRGLGRPRKYPVVEKAPPEGKRHGPGRPRKYPVVEKTTAEAKPRVLKKPTESRELDNPGRVHKAFRERKSLEEWADDDRCPLTFGELERRVALGESVEDVIVSERIRLWNQSFAT